MSRLSARLDQAICIIRNGNPEITPRIKTTIDSVIDGSNNTFSKDVINAIEKIKDIENLKRTDVLPMIGSKTMQPEKKRKGKIMTMQSL
jgi:hypothetical protein